MPTPLLDALRRGDLDATVALLRDEPDAALASAADIKKLRAQLQAVALGDRDPAWVGESTEGHHDAVDLAHLMALPPEKAAAVGAVSRRAASLLPDLRPTDLPVFVETWSRLFQRSPKNCDRNAHYPVMFAWVADGHVPAPTHDGAVNLWLQFAPEGLRPPRDGWRIPSPAECRELYTIALPRLFEAEVRPGLGAAALDQSSGGEVMGLVVHLVDTGIWDRADTLARVDAALASPARASVFQQRWLRKLAGVL